jgi:hypothetical protein
MEATATSTERVWSANGIQRMLNHEVGYKDWKFVVHERRLAADNETDLRLRAEWEAPDAITGKPERQQSRWWPLTKHMVKTEIIQTAFLCVLKAEEHEIRETFKYWKHDLAADGNGYWTSPFNSHIDIDTLASASEYVDVRVDTRPDAPANQRRE